MLLDVALSHKISGKPRLIFNRNLNPQKITSPFFHVFFLHGVPEEAFRCTSKPHGNWEQNHPSTPPPLYGRKKSRSFPGATAPILPFALSSPGLQLTSLLLKRRFAVRSRKKNSWRQRSRHFGFSLWGGRSFADTLIIEACEMIFFRNF